jgi:hypothetical protein
MHCKPPCQPSRSTLLQSTSKFRSTAAHIAEPGHCAAAAAAATAPARPPPSPPLTAPPPAWASCAPASRAPPHRRCLPGHTPPAHQQPAPGHQYRRGRSLLNQVDRLSSRAARHFKVITSCCVWLPLICASLPLHSSCAALLLELPAAACKAHSIQPHSSQWVSPQTRMCMEIDV